MAINQSAYTVISSSTEVKDIAEKVVFAAGYILCELLRHIRSQCLQKQRIPLLSENVVFLFPNVDDKFGKELLAWPHWVLKSNYTQLGILFGKFCKGVCETSKDGRDLPIPPCHLLSVRESVRARDPKFFKQAEWLLPVLESSSDVGQNVFGDLADGEDVARVLQDFCDEPTQLNFERVNATLLMSNFYGRAKESAKKELEAHKCHNAN